MAAGILAGCSKGETAPSEEEIPKVSAGWPSDFNVEDMMSLMNNTKNSYLRTVDKVTTVEGKKLDDILIHKDKGNYSSNVLKLLSDHFMVISVIEL